MNFFDRDFYQNSEISSREVKHSGSSDKPNSITHNFNLLEIRLKNPNKLIFADININYLRNKFEMLQEVIGNEIDVLLISENQIRCLIYFNLLSNIYRLL